MWRLLALYMGGNIMSALSNYLENALINAVLRNTSYTSPAQVYLALHTADPTEAGTGTEVSGGSYARQAITFGGPTDGSSSNTAAINFPVATADWGTITHFSIRDAATGGNSLFYGAWQTPKTIETSDQFVVAIGNLTVTLQ